MLMEAKRRLKRALNAMDDARTSLMRARREVENDSDIRRALSELDDAESDIRRALRELPDD